MDTYQPERLAITGATGALGLAFLRRMFERDPKLKATLLIRRTSAAFQAAGFQTWLRENETRVTLVEGDVRHLGPAQFDPLLSCDGGLWHFAALTSLTAESEQVARDARAVNFEGTVRLADAWLNRRGAASFYHISTAYVVGERHGASLESECQMGQTFRNPYESSKLAAEVSINRAFAAGIRGAILRPSVVVDDQGGTGGIKMVDACAYSVALAVKRGEPFVFRLPLTANLNMIHSDWVIAAMIDLARLPSGSGLTYHLTAPSDTYFTDIARILEKMVPGMKVLFEPDLKRTDLPSASKIFDKAVTEIRQYLNADVHFDRTHTDRDLSTSVRGLPLDLTAFVENRLKSEMFRIAHRR